MPDPSASAPLPPPNVTSTPGVHRAGTEERKITPEQAAGKKIANVIAGNKIANVIAEKAAGNLISDVFGNAVRARIATKERNYRLQKLKNQIEASRLSLHPNLS